MICTTCDNQHAARLQGRIVDGKYIEICDACGAAPVWLPDVYLGSKGGIQTDPQLVNPDTGKEIPFSTKREKAAVMKMLKLRQADQAEKQHGSRLEVKRRTYFI